MQDAGVSKVNSKEIVMVWCTISDKEINCPYFFEENVTQNFPLNLRTANNFSQIKFRHVDKKLFKQYILARFWNTLYAPKSDLILIII